MEISALIAYVMLQHDNAAYFLSVNMLRNHSTSSVPISASNKKSGYYANYM